MTLKKFLEIWEVACSIILTILFWIPIIFYFHGWKQKLIAGIYLFLVLYFSILFGKIRLFEKLHNGGKL